MTTIIQKTKLRALCKLFLKRKHCSFSAQKSANVQREKTIMHKEKGTNKSGNMAFNLNQSWELSRSVIESERIPGHFSWIRTGIGF